MVAPRRSTKTLQDEEHREVCVRCDSASNSPGTSLVVGGVEITFLDAEGEIDLPFLPDA